MKRYLIFCLLLSTTVLFSGCSSHSAKHLKHQMKTLAKEYLKSINVKDYQSLTIQCVDTLTELGYAKLTTELLTNMERAYQEQLSQTNDDAAASELFANMGEISSVASEFEDLIDEGDLKTTGILLYMVTGTIVDQNKEEQEFMFLVNPDKKTLHVLDPFGDNLLRNEQ